MKISPGTILFVAIFTVSPSGAQTDINSGIYGSEQAQRGAELYRATCISCHSADLRGNSNSPSLLGLSFLFLWEGRNLGELYSKMRTEMPTDNPGSLPPQTYADILAYILQMNDYPAGNGELIPDASSLAQIEIKSP